MLLQLIDQIRNHAAGHLRDQDAGIDLLALHFELPVFLADFLEVGRDFLKLDQVDAGVVFGAGESGDQAFGGGVAGTFRERGNAGVDHHRAGFDALHVRHAGQAGGGMAMQVNRDGDRCLQRFDQLGCRVWREQPGHILDRDGVAAHGFELARHGDEVANVMHRAGGVAQRAFRVLAGGFNRFD